jgi:nucleoside-diphosphate kinase
LAGYKRTNHRKYKQIQIVMNGRITFTIIKPDAVGKEFIGPILDKIQAGGFHIAAMKMLWISADTARKFYAVHQGRPFYDSLVEFMSSGPIVVAIIEKVNAVADYRKLIGSTDPAKADEGTIRKLYAESVQCNAVHGSDSDENAIIECNFFFSEAERYYQNGK